MGVMPLLLLSSSSKLMLDVGTHDESSGTLACRWPKEMHGGKHVFDVCARVCLCVCVWQSHDAAESAALLT